MDELEWETLDSQVAYSCGGFDIVTESVRLPDGTTTAFDYLTGEESVVALPFTTAGDVVVIDEWRHAVERTNRGLPAGNLEDDEQPSEAVHRELEEETGYRADGVDHLTTVEPANGYADSRFHYYVARDCERVESQQLDVDESIAVTTTSFEDLLAGVECGDLQDGRSVLGILYYALFERSR